MAQDDPRGDGTVNKPEDAAPEPPAADTSRVQRPGSPSASSTDRLQLWLGFWKFFLGTFAIGLITLLVNHQIQQRELEMKEQDAMGHFLDQALVADVALRHRLAEYFSNVTRSESMRTRWKAYYDVVDVEYRDTQARLAKAQAEVAAAASVEPAGGAPNIALDQKLAQVEELKEALRVKPASSDAAALAPRVYIHITDNAQRSRAEQIGRQISSALSLAVPGVQRVSKGPSVTELRYFNGASKSEADAIASYITGLGVQTQAKYIPGYESSTLIRPRHYELWFGQGALISG
jgi:hypothetical protein